MRLAYVNFDGEVALEAVEKGEKVDVEFMRKYCKDAIEGIETMIKWIQDL